MGVDRERVQQVIDSEAQQFLARNTKSRGTWDLGRDYAPNGVGTQLQYHDPHPVVVDRATGAEVWSADGDRYTDYHLGFGTMVTGHAHPKVTAAITERAQRGIHFGALTETEYVFMRDLCDRFRFSHVQLTNSGSEATGLAVKIAAALTGRSTVVKVEGGYHGMVNRLMVSTHPSLREAGPARSPSPVPWGSHHCDGRLGTHVVPFNDSDAVERVFMEHAPACLIVEPYLLNVGFVAPRPGYHAELRRLCSLYGVLLIHDEVKTGMALSTRGAAPFINTTPDLLCLGKGISGGVPCGAVLMDSAISEVVSDGEAPHYSTFAGNPLAAAAGIAALEVMNPGAYVQIQAVMSHLTQQGTQILADAGIPGYVAGAGGKGAAIFSDSPLVTYRDYEAADHDLGVAYWLVMMNRGVMLSPGQDEQWTLSVAHTIDDADYLLETLHDFADMVTA